MKRIAILGATGYIGRSLLPEFYLTQEGFSLSLFCRSKAKAKNLLKVAPKGSTVAVQSYDEFQGGHYDVIINCTGIGDPLALKKNPIDIFKVTEEIDSLVIGFLNKNPKTLYINLSSGAVYGDNFKKSITSETKSILTINNLSISEYYSIAKINSEAKHRALGHLNIVDLRVFAFFSSFVDVDAGFLMSEIVGCIKSEKVFETNEDNIIRDYITPKDLFSLICEVISKDVGNQSFDVYSKKPVSKFELLDFLKKKYNFQYSILSRKKGSASSFKKIYYSKHKEASRFGYSPQFSSLEGIDFEIRKMGILPCR